MHAFVVGKSRMRKRARTGSVRRAANDGRSLPLLVSVIAVLQGERNSPKVKASRSICN